MQVQPRIPHFQGALFLFALALIALLEYPTTFVASRVVPDTLSASSRTAGASGSQLPSASSSSLASRAGLPLLGVAFAAAAAGRRRVAVRARGGDNAAVEENEVPFEIRFPLSQFVLALGIGLTLFSFYDYAANVSGGFSGITFIYAIPVFILGLALIYAELDPIPMEYRDAAGNEDPDGEAFFNKVATKTLKKVKSDVTRHRYGDDAHLDSTLKALELTAKKGQVFPKMLKIISSRTADGELSMKMLFESKDVPYTNWSAESKLFRYDRFFGPGIWSSVSKYDAGKKIAALTLTTGTRPAKEALKEEETPEMATA